MSKSRKIIFSVITIMILIGVLFVFWKNNSNKDIILFYKDGCPACGAVEDFLKHNNIESKVKFSKLNIHYNPLNSNLFLEKAKICGIEEKDLGVPFLWDNVNSKCLIGVEEIINFFKEKTL